MNQTLAEQKKKTRANVERFELLEQSETLELSADLRIKAEKKKKDQEIARVDAENKAKK